MIKFSDFIKNLFYLVLIISLAQPFIRYAKDALRRNIEPRTKIGYLEIKGFIANSSSYVKQLQSYFSDPSIKGILLKIESQGGVSGSSEAIFNEILTMKKENPKAVAVLIENLCASGAYWIACASDHIVASSVALVGSIGSSIPYQFKLKDLLANYNIRYETTTTGSYKSTTDPFVDSTPEQRAMFQQICDQTYIEFTTTVARQRNKVSIKDVSIWADGKVFTGKQALELGLIDELGSQSNIVAWFKENVPVEDKIEWVKPKQKTAFERFFEDDGPGQETVGLTTLIQTMATHFSGQDSSRILLPHQLQVQP